MNFSNSLSAKFGYCLLSSFLFLAFARFEYIQRYAGLGRPDYVSCNFPPCLDKDNGNSLSNGFRSISALTGDSSGNLYISDTGNNRIVKIWQNGTLEYILGSGIYAPFQYHDGTLANETGLASCFGLAVDSIGNLYFSESSGNRIRILYQQNQTVYTIAGVNPGLAGYSLDEVPAKGSFISRPWALQYWNDSLLFFVEFATCRIRFIDEYGFLQTVAGAGGCASNFDFTMLPTNPLATTLTRPRGVWVNNVGSVFFVETRGFVRKVENGTMRIIAGNGGSNSFYRYGIPSTSATLGNLRNCFGDSKGNLFVAGSITDVYRIDTNAEMIYKVSGRSGSTGSVDCGIANETRHGFVEGLFWDRLSDNLYIADVSFATVRVISTEYGGCVPTLSPTLAPFVNDTTSPSREPSLAPSATTNPTLFLQTMNGNDTVFEEPKYISTIAGVKDGRQISRCAGSACYPSNHDATDNLLYYPYGVYVDGNGTIFIADSNNYRIVRVDGNNTMTTIIGTGLNPATCCDGNHSLVTNIGYIYGITGDSNGVIYFAEYSESRIRAWYPENSTVYTIAGMNPAFHQGYSLDGTSLRGNRISFPYGIFVEDDSRTMYFTENSFCTIRMFSLDSTIVTTIAGSGNCHNNQMYPWQTGVDYDALSLFLSGVYYVWVNKAGEVFFSDNNHLVWRVYNGFAHIYAGNGMYVYGADYVPATTAGISSPRGITGDTNGNIYVVSNGDSVVKKIDPSGMMYRIAGSLNNRGYRDCMDATSSSLASPNGISIDSFGNLYIADSDNYVIRKVSNDAVCAPTPTPTESPSGQTLVPSIMQSNTPTLQPTWKPTTIKPSRRPTKMPTPRPTKIPTSQPSVTPTQQPTSRPSTQPSASPSIFPTIMPSSQPTSQPSSHPSQQPTLQPSGTPSSQPSCSPTTQPSRKPTSRPSQQPSAQPTTIPSQQHTSPPSSQPSRTPSSIPSSEPSESPSMQPSSQPTSPPSSQPSSRPSSVPSTQPTTNPNSSPTCHPSSQPSTSPLSNPSSQPTSQPTFQPTAMPTIKTKPPSIRPSTSTPSRHPTTSPTFSSGIVGIYAVTARLSNDGLACLVQLNIATNQGGKSGIFVCSEILGPSSMMSDYSCSWSNSSTISIRLTSKNVNALNIGSQIGLIANLPTLLPFKTVTGQTVSVAGRQVSVQPPSQPIRPTVVVKASSSVSSCANWIVDLTSSSGNAGGEWTNVSISVIQFPANGYDNSTLVLSQRLLRILSTNSPISVPSSWLVAGVSYRLRFQLCNYLGGCGWSEDVLLTVSNTTLSPPVVVILGGSEVVSYVNKSVIVAAAAYVPLCFGQQRTSGLVYSWSVRLNGVSVAVTNRAADPSSLMLSPYSLSAGKQYIVRVQVTDSRSNLVSEASITVVTLVSNVVARISPEVATMIGIGQSVTLDASSSFDPDSPSQALTFTWVTSRISTSTGDVVQNVNNPISLQVQDKSASSVGSMAVVTGVEFVQNVSSRVTLTVLANGKSAVTITREFRIANEPMPTVIISTDASSVTNIDSSKSVSVSGFVTAASTSVATWSSDTLSATSLKSMVAGGTISVPIVANRVTPVNLFFLPNMLEPGRRYNFALSCGKASVSISVSTNDPPYGGSLETNPSTGYSLQTSFVLATKNWIDTDLPLQYSFKFYSEATASWLSVQSVSPATFCSSILPTGTEGSNYMVNVSVSAIDALGMSSVSSAKDMVIVQPVPASQVAGIISSLLSNASSAGAVQQVVSVGSAALNTVNCTGVSDTFCRSMLNRGRCSSTSHTCGPCLSGYVGIEGDSNEACFAMNVDGGRRLTGGSGTCTSNNQCEAWQTCDPLSRHCKDKNRTCPRACSGHGSCSFVSLINRATVLECSVLSTNCDAVCLCGSGYSGQDCSRLLRDVQQEQIVRGDMLSSLSDSLATTNLDETSITNVAKSVSSLVSSSWSVSNQSVSTLLDVSGALVGVATNGDGIRSSSLASLLAPWDHAMSSMAKADSSAAFNMSRATQYVESFAALVATEALPDAPSTDSILSVYRVTTQSFGVVSGQVNGSLSVPSSALEKAQQVSKTMIRVMSNGSSAENENFVSASAIVLQMIEYQQQLVSASLPVQSNVVSVSSQVLDGTDTTTVTSSPFEIEIVHNQPLSFNGTDAEMSYFEVNCTMAKVENASFVCPSSNTTLQFQCDGQKEGTWRKYCPVLRPTCQGFLKNELFATDGLSSVSSGDRVTCQTKVITASSTTCVCRPNNNGRRRRLSGTDSTANYVAVIVTYVANEVEDTFQETHSLGPDVFEKSYIVITLYASLWVACGFLMIGMYYKAKAVAEKKREAALQRRHQSKSTMSVSQGLSGMAPESRRRRGGGVVALNQSSKSETSLVELSDQSSSKKLSKQVLQGKLLAYIESVIPKVFDDKPTLMRLLDEMSRNHVYVKMVVEGLSERRTYIDVFHMMTNFTVLMFLLAMMYDLQYPSDDGSCGQYNNDVSCLQRKSILDTTQSYCYWSITKEASDMQGEQGVCRFNSHINVSFGSAAICAVVTSWFSSILTRPLDYVFNILNAPSTEDIHDTVKASSAFDKLHSSAMLGLRRASIAANRAVHSILPSSETNKAVKANALILHTTRIPEDTHEARKEIRIAVQELEQQGSRIASHSVSQRRSLAERVMSHVDIAPTANAAASDMGQMTISPAAIMNALKQQRCVLTGDKLAEFDRSWYFVLHYDAWRAEMETKGAHRCLPCAGKVEALPYSVDDFLVHLMIDTITTTMRENQEVNGLTDVEAGLHILQTFVRDILGKHTSVAKIFDSKAKVDFYRTNAVSRKVKLLAVVFVVALNGFCLFYAILRGYSKGLAWQYAYAISCLVQLATEVLFFETLETFWVDFLLPNFAHKEMGRCRAILKRMVENLSELMESEAMQSMGVATDMEMGGYSAQGKQGRSRSMSKNSILLNVPRHFYVSHQLARRHPTLIESMMVLSYESYLPVGLEVGSNQGNADFSKGVHMANSIGMWFISLVTYFSATFLALIATVPFEFHRIVIRFFGPFVVGGLVLAWAFISINILFLAVFFGGIGIILLYVGYSFFYLYTRDRNQTSHVAAPHSLKIADEASVSPTLLPTSLPVALEYPTAAMMVPVVIAEKTVTELPDLREDGKNRSEDSDSEFSGSLSEWSFRSIATNTNSHKSSSHYSKQQVSTAHNSSASEPSPSVGKTVGQRPLKNNLKKEVRSSSPSKHSAQKAVEYGERHRVSNSGHKSEMSDDSDGDSASDSSDESSGSS